MLTIRLFRTGKKNQPFFKIVATEKKNPPQGGRFLEILGFLNPLTKEKRIKAERIKHWLNVGAQMSDTVYNLLISEKIITGKKKPVHKKPKKKAETPKPEISAEAREEVKEVIEGKEGTKVKEGAETKAEVKKEEEIK